MSPALAHFSAPTLSLVIANNCTFYVESETHFNLKMKSTIKIVIDFITTFIRRFSCES